MNFQQFVIIAIVIVLGALAFFFILQPFRAVMSGPSGGFRWRFLDGESGEEVEQKKATIAKIDKFWQDFRDSGLGGKKFASLAKDPPSSEWLRQHLAEINPAFEWEMGVSPNGKTELAICAGGAVELLPVVETMIERAGTMPNWTLTSYRLPMNSETVESAFEARTSKKLPPFRVELEKTKSNSFDCTVFSPEFIGDDRMQDLETAFILTDIVIGENNVNNWQNFIQTKHDESATVAGYSSKKAAAEFSSKFIEEKDKILATLPDKPIWSIPKVSSVTLFSYPKQLCEQLLKQERCRLTFISSWLELSEAIASQQKFHSERFSKLGEKFVYLHVIAEKEYSDEERGNLEKELDRVLRSAHLGAVVAFGRGKPNSYYFDLCVSDLDKAIPVLRKFCQDQNLPRRSWLRFYDSEWKHEWVRMLPNTPNLKDPTMIW